MNKSTVPEGSPGYKAGEPFIPWQESHARGFYSQDAVGRQRDLTDGRKRLYDRLVRFAGKDGRCFPSQAKLAYELGKSERQIRRDLDALAAAGLIRWRDGQRENHYEFLWHSMFDCDRTPMSAQDASKANPDRTSTSAQDVRSEVSDRTHLSSDRTPMSGSTGHVCPPNPINPVKPSSSSSEVLQGSDSPRRMDGKNISSENEAAAAELLHGVSGLRVSEADAGAILRLFENVSAFRDWLDLIAREGRNTKIRSIAGYRVDAERWVIQKRAQPQTSQYQPYRPLMRDCDRCADAGLIRNDDGTRKWCFCATADKLRAERGEGYAEECEREERELIAALEQQRQESKPKPPQPAKVAPVADPDRIVETIACSRCGGEVVRRAGRIDWCECKQEGPRRADPLKVIEATA